MVTTRDDAIARGLREATKQLVRGLRVSAGIAVRILADSLAVPPVNFLCRFICRPSLVFLMMENETHQPSEIAKTTDHQVYKIHSSDDFSRITRGIKVARCMQSSSSFVPDDNEQILSQLVVSDSLCCSYCNTEFEDKVQQRLHYKLDWHRYNLKQHLNGLKSISEDSFNKLAGEGDMSSLSGSEVESENEDDAGTSETGTSSEQTKNELPSKTGLSRSRKVSERRGRIIESDISDTEYNEEMSKERKLKIVASRHTKVFFENDDGNIFSIYRCLLHHKKNIPEKDTEMIAQALDSGKKTKWTVIMVGGGHFAAAVFQDGEPLVHKTFHSYTVRAKQGFAQSSRTNHAKSAGASLRKYNEESLIRHVQEILESWSLHINNSSAILYRAVGPHNRTVLFGGKNPPLDKNDFRIRPLPFPTRRATFREVKRVYDILSTMEIYGCAEDFTDCFPNSPRQPIRKKVSKPEIMSEIPEGEIATEHNSNGNSQENDKIKAPAQSTPEKQHRNSRPHIDRAKSRKSPNRPLPDIIVRLAQSSSESEMDAHFSLNFPLTEENFEVSFKENLQAFQDTVPRYLKNKKAYRQKKKVKKDTPMNNEVLSDAKTKLWTACKQGDNDLLSSVINNLLAKIKACEEEQEKKDITDNDCIRSNNNLVNTDDVAKLVNDTNEDGNTMLHLAALGGHCEQVWLLLEIGSDPCNKNKKLQTPYAAANDKKTRNMFRRFMEVNPDKFNYQKSQIPGPLSDEIEQAEIEKKRQQRKLKRFKEKVKRKEFELKKQEENEKQRFLNLSDKEKRALVIHNRMLNEGYTVISRCFQCAIDMTDKKIKTRRVLD
ncbi:ankyrin repeat and zinc finger domain-containing protein 1 isoform X2 [Monomorium pharaonis]|uniref:ankyrin repeat and zinc finger domain-containing protein 1 isoform X2 n=1 Tax=Monomorium pharaonis TaxID=307658 RepID=UPI001745ED2D|nr:ankyrin repeat and zinc finger domain-containing protein 1 isoform X2 [Monomorium pharaonis]